MQTGLLKHWSLTGIVIVFLLAAFWHFAYSLFPTPLMGAISPVNESPWEHAKLFFLPAILYFTAEYFAVGKEFPNYIFAHSVALLSMPVFMLCFYYLYRPFFTETFPLDILNTLITVVLGFFIAYKLAKSDLTLSSPAHLSVAVIIVVLMLSVYAFFTYCTPKWGPFLDHNKEAGVASAIKDRRLI
jgi:hypothetical protein